MKTWSFLKKDEKEGDCAERAIRWLRPRFRSEVSSFQVIHPAVKEAAVIGVPHAYRGETVKAFVAVKEGFENKVSVENLIEFCKERMAAYKYPRILKIVPEIPRP